MAPRPSPAPPSKRCWAPSCKTRTRIAKPIGPNVDLAIILTGLLAGLRADELRQANVGDIRTTDDGAAIIRLKGKGGKERSVPVQSELLSVIETYLDSRAIRLSRD